MLKRLVLLSCTIFLCMASRAFALGLGAVQLESALNQPLQVRIEIVQLGDVRLNDVSVQLASPADFQRFNVSRDGFLSNIRFRVESVGEFHYVVLTTSQLVRKPYLNFILDTRWPNGRILSEHTVLLDLPVLADTPAQSVAVRQPISQSLQPPSMTPAPAATPAVTAPAAAPPVAAVSTPAAAPATPPPAPASTPVPRAATPAPVTQAAAPAPTPVATATPALAPAATPAPVATPAEAVAAGPETLTTQASDTLWSIALRVRPNESVSMQQTMLAIQRLNPDAFIGGNINLLRAGQVLRIPDFSQIQSVDQQQAVSEVVRQAQQTAQVGAQPLAAPAPGPNGSAAATQGQLSVITQDDGQTAAGGAGAALAEENAELDARIAALENQIALREEEVDRARIEREELLSRLDDLEVQIAAAMEIITLQDQQLAQLQESLAEAAAQAAAQQAVAADMAPVRRPSFLESLLDALTGSIMIIVAGAAVLVLGLVALLMRRNRATGGDDDDMPSLVAGVTGAAVSAGMTAAAAEPKAAGRVTPKVNEVDEDLSDILSIEAFDEFTRDFDDDTQPPVAATPAPAATSMAEEDDVEAALDADAGVDFDDLSDTGLAMDDLAEASRDDVADFDLDALIDDGADLESDADLASEPEPANAVDVGNSLDFDDLEFDLGSDVPAGTEDEEDALAMAAAAEALDLPEPEPDSGDDFSADATVVLFPGTLRAPPAEAPPAPPVTHQDAPVEAEHIEFDLGEPAPSPAPAASTEAPATAPKAAAADEADLDFSLDSFDLDDGDEMSITFDLGEAEPAPAPADAPVDVGDRVEFTPSAPAPAAERAPETPAADDLEHFDFDLGTDAEDGAPTSEAAASAALAAADDDLEGFDFDLDVDAGGSETAAPDLSAMTDAGEVEAESLDLDDVDFDLDFDVDSEPTATAPTASTPSTPADAAEEEDFDFLSDDDSAATKLELAYAYQEMGDFAGARDILAEVVKEGKPAQVAEARYLLEAIDKQDGG